VKPKRAKPARVYPAESDPRQAKPWTMSMDAVEMLDFRVDNSTKNLAREFGPWVRADGSLMRDMRKRKGKR